MLTILLAGVPDAKAQGIFGPPSAAQCQSWAAALGEGGQQALDAVTYGAIMHCPDVAPAALSGAIRNARAATDTAYLGRLAAQAGQVRDAALFQAALEVTADSRASDRARVMAMLVTVAQLGAGQDVQGRTRPELFTTALPTQGVCGFEVGGAPALDNGLPVDAERLAARAIDPVRYGRGVSALVRNLARCARSAIDPEIPTQVDVSGSGWTMCAVWCSASKTPRARSCCSRTQPSARTVVRSTRQRWRHQLRVAGRGSQLSHEPAPADRQ